MSIIEESAARAAHNVVSVYREAVGLPTEPPWVDLSTERRELLSATAAIAEPSGSLAEYHGLVSSTLTEAGWSYGPVDDVDAKVSPALVSWGDLTDTTRAQLSLAWSTARSVARALREAGVTP